MTLIAQLENLETMIVKGRVPGTARTLVNQQKNQCSNQWDEKKSP